MSLSKFIPLIVFMIFLLPLAVVAGVDVGEKMPHDLSALDQNGAQQNFESIRGDKGLVLVFVRSADWCPYCQTQLIDLGERGSEITDLGYSLVMLSYDATDKLEAFTNKYDFKYTMLSDQGSEIIKAFGILNEEMKPDSLYYGIPHPSIYIINSEAYIQARLIERDYKKRPPVEDIVALIKNNS